MVPLIELAAATTLIRSIPPPIVTDPAEIDTPLVP